MEELTRELETLIVNFRNHQLDFKTTIAKFEILIEKYIALNKEHINYRQVNQIKYSFLNTLDKVKKIMKLNANFRDNLLENMELKRSLGLVSF